MSGLVIGIVCAGFGVLASLTDGQGISEEPPAWTQAVIHKVRTPLSESLSLPIDGAPLRIVHRREGAARLDIKAHATTEEIVVRLEGDGWDSPSPLGRRTLEQNLAHELAHHRQFQAGPTEGEPLWWHEGTAEAMALGALVRSRVWTAGLASEWRDKARMQCVGALGRGTLDDLWAGGDRDAIYACSYLMVEAAAEASGMTVLRLRRGATRAMASGTALSDYLEKVAGKDMARSLHAFAGRSYVHVDGAWVIEQLQQGEL